MFPLLAILAGLTLARLSLPLAGALIAGAAVVLLILIQPLVGLALTLLVGPLAALENVTVGQTLVDSGQILLLITLAAWLARGLLRGRVKLTRTFLNVPLALFVYVMALSLLQASSLELGLKELLKWLEIGLVMLMVTDLASGRVSEWASRRETRLANSQTRKLTAMLLLAGLSQALVGIWQFGLRGDGPEHFLVLGRFYRAYGTFEQPNPFGGFMNLIALLGLGTLLGLVAAFWQRRGAGAQGRRACPELAERGAEKRGGATNHCLLGTVYWVLFVALSTVAMGLALLFSWSRGAWLGFVMGVGVLALFSPKKRWQGVLLVVVVAVSLVAAVQVGLMPATITERLSGFGQDLRFGDVRGLDINDANYAVLERLAHWQAALAMARDNLWFGVGFGNYEPAYRDYALINWPYPLGHAHNYYLNILAEAGVAGLVAYMAFWAAVFWQTLRVLSRLDWPQRGIALGLIAAWTALSAHHLVDKLYVNNVYIHVGVMLGLLQLLDQQVESHVHNGDTYC